MKISFQKMRRVLFWSPVVLGGLLLVSIACSPALYPPDGLLCDSNEECWGDATCVKGVCVSSGKLTTPEELTASEQSTGENTASENNTSEDTVVSEGAIPEEVTTDAGLPEKSEPENNRVEQAGCGKCKPGEVCKDGKCTPDGTCGKGKKCRDGWVCVRGVCQGNCQCAPKETKCRDQGQILVCKDDCSGWRAGAKCDPLENLVCKDGKCSCNNDCTREGAACQGRSGIITCKKNNAGCLVESVGQCPGDATCREGRCCACQPGQTVCSGDKATKKCKPDCSGWEKPKKCKKDHECDNNRCQKE